MIPIYKYGADNLEKVFKRSQINDLSLKRYVEDIVESVRVGGDEKLFELINKYDGAEVELNKDNFIVTEAEFENAYRLVSKELLEALRDAKENVLDYHRRQREKFENVVYEKDGNELGWQYRAMNRVGLYIPGGKASYPSSILMCALPAVASGVNEIVIATPNPFNPLTLVAAKECGVKTVYKMGGAHAVSALAYGTESVEKVDLIAGPGNVFVTLAKKIVYGNVAIDMIAGPSEILVIADSTANPTFVASDLISQAEHDEMAASILVTDSLNLANAVQNELVRITESLERRNIITKSLSENGAIIVVDHIKDAVKISDIIAPEHLEICTAGAKELAKNIKNAGAIFIGNYSPEPLGDYLAGPSHCLPTSGTARYFSVLSVDTFMKKISYINYSESGLKKVKDKIIAIADCESLTGHANAIKVRF